MAPEQKKQTNFATKETELILYPLKCELWLRLKRNGLMLEAKKENNQNKRPSQ